MAGNRIDCIVRCAAAGGRVGEPALPGGDGLAPGARGRRLRKLVLLVCVLWGLVAGQEVVAENAGAGGGTNSEEAVRSYQLLQEQLRDLQQSLERGKQEADVAAAKQGDALAGRLQAIEQNLSAQRSKELETLQAANRWLLVAAGAFAVLGFLTALGVAYFQWRAVNKLAEISAALPAAFGVGPARMALGPGESSLVSVSRPVEQSNMRLLGTLERLEKRIFELEQSPQVSMAPGPAVEPEGFGAPGRAIGISERGEAGTGKANEVETKIGSLLGKGQSLLNLDQAEEALGCFEEALRLNGRHADAMVKKGMALERLGKVEEAIACYDQTIAMDDSMTVAYLYKGGLYNRLERYDEALVCFEAALRKQERRGGEGVGL